MSRHEETLRRASLAVPARVWVIGRIHAAIGGFAVPGGYFMGRIEAAHDDGTYDIQFDDGDEEKRVQSLLVYERENYETGTPFPKVGGGRLI